MIQEPVILVAAVATGLGLYDVVVTSPMKLREAYREGLSVLSGIVEAKDPRAEGHSGRVAELSVKLASALGMRRRDCERMRYAALLHDIGKVKVPRAILTKPDMLDPDEFDTVKVHSAVGAQILANVEFVQPLAGIVRAHHERPDGRGYPDGLKGDQIPIESRVIGLAAAYEAMTSARSWRPAMGESDVLEVIRAGRGTEFDADVVDAFFQLL